MKEELRTRILSYNRKLADNQAIVDMVNEAGGIKVTRSQSDKLGYDWANYYVNDILVRQVYEEQATPAGTAENPIVYSPTLPLIPNAFYTYEGVRKVWMGEAGAVAGWDDDGWEVF